MTASSPPKVMMLRTISADQAVNKWAEAINSGGYEVCVLLWDMKTASIAPGKVPMKKFNLRRPPGNPVMIVMLPFYWMFLLTQIAKERPNLVHAFDLDTIPPVLILRRLYHFKFVYTSLDFYADTLKGHFLPRFRAILAFLERRVAEKADHVFVVDDGRLSELVTSRAKGYSVVYNTPPDLGAPSSDIEEDFVFYGGNVSQERGILDLIKAVQIVEGLRLVIAGVGTAAGAVTEISHAAPSKISYLGWLKYEDVLQLTRRSLAVVALYDPKLRNSTHAAPNKIFEAMMAGKPIVVNEGTSLARFVRHVNCGVVIPFGNVVCLSNALTRLMGDKQFAKEMGANARQAYDTCYNWKLMRVRILRTYGELLS